MNRHTYNTLLLASANICMEEADKVTLDAEKTILRAAANMLSQRAYQGDER